ncbi:MAG: hypothetical protein ACOCRU_00755 [bacterium]
MENKKLRLQFEKALDNIVAKFRKDKKCLALVLLGSMSHDLIWEWSELEILAIYNDSYKGDRYYNLYEQEVWIVLNIMKRSDFCTYIESADFSDYWFCALSKSTMLFSRDITVNEFLEDIFYIGDRDREIEMLMGFSEAIYHLNKAEKNFRVMENIENALYFLPELARGIAWIEVARNRAVPEREIIAQARQYNPEIFKKIYDPLFYKQVKYEIIDNILKAAHKYMEENTREVYRPIISYLKEHGTLKDFSLKARGTGLNIKTCYDWLYRMGITDRYSEPIKISNQLDDFYELGYRIKG